MYEWQKWCVRHPLVFWVNLMALTVLLGVALPVGPFFFAAAVASGVVWHVRAHSKVPRVEAGRARRRIEDSRRARRDVAAATPPPVHLPPGPHILLPPGQKIQVTKEERHLEGIVDILEEGEVRHSAATLHRLVPAPGRATKERVQVRIDGIAVGELSAYMSEHFIPLITVCEERGIEVVCRASLKGNQLKADVVLDTTKAIDLGDDWIEEHILGAGTP